MKIEFIKKRFLVSIVFILFLSCKIESTNCGVNCDESTEVYFHTNFDDTVLENDKYSKVNIGGNKDWAVFNENESIGQVEISYEDGNDSQRMASIITDPDSSENKILKFQILEPHITEGTWKKGRVQLNVNDNSCVKEIHQTIRLKLNSDMSFLTKWNEPVHWLSVFEFWNNADWTNEKYPFRITVNLNKEAGAGNEFNFKVKADFKNNCKICKWNVLWEETASNYSIPFGEWMQIELYLKEGDNNQGEFYMAIVGSNQEKIELFNRIGYTQHPEDNCPDGYTHMQPLKLYTSDHLINYMKKNARELSVYWDDWSFSTKINSTQILQMQ